VATLREEGFIVIPPTAASRAEAPNLAAFCALCVTKNVIDLDDDERASLSTKCV